VDAEREQLEALVATIAQLERTVATKTTQLAETDELLARTEEVDERVAEGAGLRKQDDAARAAREKVSALANRRAGVLERIEGERRTLAKRIEDASSLIARLQLESEELDAFAAKLATVDETLAENGDPREPIEEVREQLDGHKASSVRFEEQHTTLAARINETQDKIALLGAGGGECPVCGTALDAAHRTKVKKSLVAEGKGLVRERDAAKAAREEARKEAARCAEDLKRLQKTLSDHEGLVAIQTELRARLARAPVVQEQLATSRTEIERDTELLADDRFAKELLAEIDGLDTEISGAYDAEAHEQVLARLKELQPYEALKGRLVEAARTRRTLQADIEDAGKHLDGARGDLQERQARVLELEARLGPGGDLRRVHALADAALTEALRAAVEAAKTLAALEERLEVARRSHAELERAEVAERDAALEHRRFRRLVEAFGRSGIPQRIIENERPQLEHEANRILDRLTDDPMAVQFQFHRDTKAGKPKETLEVLVRPHDGEPRDFAMFSGGEAFRIAFAVRLAMSKLLVRRAGARLQTLVIDEGFGTQDPQGRERLIEAINLAREEFAKVLVITHLEDLKDQFGVQITVTKGPTGSLVGIERG
jgi:exonuclease SbcC